MKKKFPSENVSNVVEYYQPKLLLGDNTLHNLPIDSLKTASWNARRHYDEESLAALANDLKTHGQIEPILVRKDNDQFQIISGERRFRAALKIGLTTLKAIILDLNEASARKVALAVNLERADLNHYEETLGYLQILELEVIPLLTATEFSADLEGLKTILAKMWQEYKKNKDKIITDSDVGKKIQEIFSGSISWQSFKSHRLPLLNLPQDIQDALLNGSIEYTKARLLAKIENDDKRHTLLSDAIENNLSLNEIQKQISLFSKNNTEDSDYEVSFQNKLTRLKRKLKGKSLTIEQQQQLEILLDALYKLADEAG